MGIKLSGRKRIEKPATSHDWENEATRSFYAKHSQTRGIFGEISILLCFTLVHLMFSPCLDSRYQCNHIATNFSFSDSSFFKLLLRNGYLCLTAANALRRISDQLLQYLHSLWSLQFSDFPWNNISKIRASVHFNFLRGRDRRIYHLRTLDMQECLIIKPVKFKNI